MAKKSSILILGKGYIGTRLGEALSCPASDFRVHHFQRTLDFILENRPKIVINSIGHTGKRNIDESEIDPDKTLTANSFVPLMLAEICLRHRIKLIHISSGCIFQNQPRPITEGVTPNYVDLFYSRTKIYAEQALQLLSNSNNILIIRMRLPLDDRPHPKNILTKLLSFKRVVDIPNSVTYLPDMMKAVKHLIAIDARGIYNVVNKGGLRYPQLLDVYRKFVPNFHYEIMDVRDLPTPRTNLILSTQKLEKTGFQVRPIQKVLVECVQNYLKSS